MNEHLFLQQVVSFQHVTLESRNFIRLVGIKVMLKCAVLMENWISVSEHWDDKKGYLNDKKGCLDNTHRPVIPARDAGI
ncbi:hypothetical protein GO685_01345 [Wolbachia endosymbiont of Madathamugadia hiepei]|uniref:hypothetical protein n=1 Tax=Wolbachia endosymbiont of Madathamugadia hiepei TaxID=1241303 RepID=UPI0015890095|nr:hypothetical protein [Wolbachia endosymbiont of Madathamugadia hiepei]NUX01169.1 hypothetical protein [Wolbachia endosymbiont of Madathamugadia hiepei]